MRRTGFVITLYWLLMFVAPAHVQGQEISLQGTPGSGCKIMGCSGQICGNAGDEETMTTCEYKDEYACYGRHSRCEIQDNGECGWSDTRMLQMCLGTSEETSNVFPKVPMPKITLPPMRDIGCVGAGCEEAVSPTPTSLPTATPTPTPVSDVYATPTPTRWTYISNDTVTPTPTLGFRLRSNVSESTVNWEWRYENSEYHHEDNSSKNTGGLLGDLWGRVLGLWW